MVILIWYEFLLFKLNYWNLRCFVCYTVILLVLIWWCGQMILQCLQGELYEAWQVFLSSFKSGHWYLSILIIITIASCCGSLMKPLLLTSHYIDDSQLGTFPLVESQTEHHCQHWHHCELAGAHLPHLKWIMQNSLAIFIILTAFPVLGPTISFGLV